MDRILYIENDKRNENIEVNTFMKELENAEPKNIQETTATEKDLLAVGLKCCKNCVKDN